MTFSRLAPLPFLLAATLAMLALVTGAGFSTLDMPWLGISTEASSHGVRITSVNPDGPAYSILEPGDYLTAIETVSGDLLDLTHYQPGLNPHALTSYAAYNHYMARQGKIYQALSQPHVSFTSSNHTSVQLTPAAHHPFSSLPIKFWLINLFGALACLISLSVWIFQPAHWPARLLAISGASFFFATLQQSIWAVRELAMPTPEFELLMRGNHVFMHLLLITLMILMTIYPRRLKNSKWLIGGLLLFLVVMQINENLQFLEPPLHAFYIFLPFYYLLGLGFTFSQWQLSRYRPTDRGALRWVFLTILLAMGGGMLVYFLPVLLGIPPLGGLATMVGIASTLYIGFALGILRYRLFQIERWWFIAWAWFLGGLAVLLFDLLVVFIFQIPRTYALSLSLLFVGWLYFPVRQWFWQRITAYRQNYMEYHLPDFVETLFTSSASNQAQHWQQALERVFRPLTIEPDSLSLTQPQLAKNGASLHVPSFDPDIPSLELLYSQKGKHLFNSRDLAMANALSAVARRITNLRDARKEGAGEERKRIMRDLHDDVGGRLLTLIHTAPNDNQEGLARSALQALRDTIYALDETSRYHLDDLINSFCDTLDERLQNSLLTPQLHLSITKKHITLWPRQFINICRVLDEAITNAINHSADGILDISVDAQAQYFKVQISNPINFEPARPTPLFRGRGLSNMQTRVEEINGSLSLYSQPGTPPSFCLKMQIHLPNVKNN